MARDYKAEAIQEASTQSANYRWIRSRIETVRKNVTAHDVLRRNGISLRYSDDREEQFSCPFHGRDVNPSARVYPETVKGPSHVWCFTCHESWDVIALWRKFYGSKETKFTRVLLEIERAFGIVPPERPPLPSEMADYVDPEVEEIKELFEVCEKRLTKARESFDMKSHLTIGSVLDRSRYQFETGALSVGKVRAILQQVLDKIGTKVRA